jgi:hypothetical protein
MNAASNSVIETARYPESSAINAKTSMFGRSMPANGSTNGAAFNNLINICATLILTAILVLLELHIRRSILHSDPFVVRTSNDAVPGISLHIPAQSNAVER